MASYQEHFSFLLSQINKIETEAYKVRYPGIQYQDVVPVDSSAHEWVGGITHFATDHTGRAKAINQRANDVPMVDLTRAKYDVIAEMFGVGYDYTIGELEQAMMLNIDLKADKAVAARRANEELMDDICMNGSQEYGWDGFVSHSASTSVDSEKAWENASGDDIVKEINNALSGLWVDSRTVEMADTILLPPKAWTILGTVPRSTTSGTDTTALQFLRENNVYTQETGKKLMIRSLRALEGPGRGSRTGELGATGSGANRRYGRMIAYRRDPQVLKFHMPMPYKFLPPQQDGMRYEVIGLTRVAGLEIRLPASLRYVNGILDDPNSN